MRTILLRLAMPALLLGISVPALAANPKVVSEKAVSVSGKVESRKEAGMLWYELNTGTGKPLLIGAVYAFTGSNGDCLENAKNSGSPVTISGKLTMYDNGTRAALPGQPGQLHPLQAASSLSWTISFIQSFWVIADTSWQTLCSTARGSR